MRAVKVRGDGKREAITLQLQCCARPHPRTSTACAFHGVPLVLECATCGMTLARLTKGDQ